MKKYYAALCADIFLQLWAHFLQFSAQDFICISFVIFSQFSAHASQIIAQVLHTCMLKSELRNMKFVLVWQISAQSSKRRIWTASECAPPFWRQSFTVIVQTAWQALLFSMHDWISWLSLSWPCIVVSPIITKNNMKIYWINFHCSDRYCRSWIYAPEAHWRFRQDFCKRFSAGSFNFVLKK